MVLNELKGKLIPHELIKRFYKDGAIKAYSVSTTSEDVFYVISVRKDGASNVLRTRRRGNTNYYDYAAPIDIIPQGMHDDYTKHINEIFGVAVEIVADAGRLIHFLKPLDFYYLPPDDDLIGDMDSFLESAGFKSPFDELYRDSAK